MTQIDVNKLAQIKAKLYTSAARETFGEQGTEALTQLLTGIVQIYSRYDPSIRKGRPLAVCVDATLQPSVLSGKVTAYVTMGNFHRELDEEVVVRIQGNGTLEIRKLENIDLRDLSTTAVVYYFDGIGEKIIIGGQFYALLNPVPGYVSMFCRPTFGSLKDALEHYRASAAAHSSCEILKGVWHDERRWWFKAKPESTMRKSLTNYLRNVMRDANVRPEQNVDESHPVDIHVGFSMTQLHAIIEIKWLGKSMTPAGKEAKPFWQGRALEGAQQLADYLDKSHEWAPQYETRGYLVVYDGRRNKLSEGVTHLDQSDALGYENGEIEYDETHLQRRDFEMPVRMFMYPNLA